MTASVMPSFAARLLQARCVGFGVREVQRIVRGQSRIVLDPAAIEQQLQTLARIQPEVILAFRADVRIGFQILFPDDGAAAGALGPQPFGLYAPFVGRRGLLDRFFSRLNQAIDLSIFPYPPGRQ